MQIQPYERGTVPMMAVQARYFEIHSNALLLMRDGVMIKFDLGTTPERKQNYMSGWCSGEADFY